MSARGGRGLLEVRGVSVRFGGIVALDDVSFEIRTGEILGLIGPNGAGKTTLFNCLSRLYRPGTGDILLEDRSILRVPAHRMAELGVGRTFQNLALFPRLSVLDNVAAGGHARVAGDALSDALRLPWARRRDRATIERSRAFVRELELEAVADRPVGELPFGIQKRVELARALASDPKLLLLDEPACGLNHDEVAVLRDTIARIRAEHALAVLLVEHHMGLVMAVSDRIVALNFGRKIAEGTPGEVGRDPEVVRAYLGTAAA